MKALTEWKFYLRPDDVWEAMLKDCASAKVSIDIEQYIFINDRVGERFLDILKKKAGEGVKVRLLCDAVGSPSAFSWFDSWGVHGTGVEVRFFNVIKPWLPYSLMKFFLRDHKKLMIVDSVIGYTGGVGIWDKMSDWRDTHVRVKGPVVAEMMTAFETMWAVAGEGKRLMKFTEASVPTGRFHFLTSAPRTHQRFIYHDLIEAIRSAEHYIYLTTPYFIPDHRLLRVLRLAVRRRVDVRLLVPQASDVFLADIAASSYFKTLLKGGIRIYRYRGKTLHVKAGVIDDKWGTVGSANLDNFSLRYNYEGNLVSANEEFIAELKGHFMTDLKQTRELLRSEWNQRPFIQKLKERLIWPLRKLL